MKSGRTAPIVLLMNSNFGSSLNCEAFRGKTGPLVHLDPPDSRLLEESASYSNCPRVRDGRHTYYSLQVTHEVRLVTVSYVGCQRRIVNRTPVGE